MWKAEYRAMTPEERSELRRILGRFSGFRREALGSGLGAFLAVVLSIAAPATLRIAIGAVLAGGFLGGLGARASRARVDRAMREALERDLRNGKVQAITVVAHEAVRLKRPDGTLAGYFIAIGGGLVMFVEPREWERSGGDSGPVFERLFPCSHFSLIRAPHSGLDLDFTCLGARFEPRREIEAPPQELLEAVVKDGEVLPAHLDSLEEDLGRPFRPPSADTTPQPMGEFVGSDR